jgi:Lipocalin-like domain
MRTAFAFLGVILAFTRPVFADDGDKLVGTWKIVSAVVEDVQTKEQKPLYGEHPKGYLILLPTGRMMSLLVSEGRKAPQTDAERSTAYRSMVAYTGKYTLEGNKWTTKPDVAFGPGTDRFNRWRALDPRRAMKLPPACGAPAGVG